MKNLKNRFLRTVLFSIIFLAVLLALLLTIENRLLQQDVSRDGQFKAESVRNTVEQYYARADEMREWFYAKVKDNVRLMTFILKDRIVNGEFNGVRNFDDGIVVRIVDGKLEDPDALIDYLPNVTAEKILNEYEPFSTFNAAGEIMFVTSGRIRDGWYYLDWTDYDEYMDYMDSQDNLERLIDYMSSAYGGEFLLIPKDSSDGTIRLKTKGLEECKTIADLGITAEDLNNGSFDLSAGGKNYKAYVIPNMESNPVTIVYFDHIGDESDTGMHRTLTLMGFAFCFLAVLITFCFSVLWRVKENQPGEAEFSRYAPDRMKQKTILFCVVFGILLLAIGFFSSIVQESHHENQKGNDILNSLELQLEGLLQNAVAAEQIEVDWYEYFGQKISAELTRDPGLLAKEKLSEIARIISSGIIMVFDEQGKEIACSSDYIGYSLFDEELYEAATPFRPLLKGVPSYIQTPEENFNSGQETYVIGVRYAIPNTEKFGAILLWVDPSLLLQTRVSDSIESVYSNLATNEEFLMNVDPETKEILTISNKDLKKVGIKDLNQDSDANGNNGGLDFFVIGDLIYYVISRQINDKLYYYGADITEATRTITFYSLSVSLFFTAGCLLISAYALREYTKKNFEQLSMADPGKPGNGKKDAALDGEKSKITNEIVKYWKSLSPTGKAMKVSQVLCGLFMLVLIGAAYRSQNATMAFLVTGSWQKGFNPFAAAVIFAVLCIGNLVLVIVDLVFLMLFSEIGARERAVFQIVRSLLKFILYAAMVYISLDCLGVNTSALVASMGIISVALSLGSKDLVSDILAGLGIVFDGALRVGDFVEISGFKGIVEEIGIRSTKIRDTGSNNYMIINNHDVKNVVNFSKMASKCKIDLEIPIVVPIDVVDSYLSRELPQIGKEIPEILGKPFFGVSGLGRFYMTISVVAVCEEKDIKGVKKKLLRKLKDRLDIILAPYLEKINLSGLSITIE